LPNWQPPNVKIVEEQRRPVDPPDGVVQPSWWYKRIGVHGRVGTEEKVFLGEFQSVKVKASAMVPRRRTGAGISRTDGAPPFLRPPIGPELDLALAELPAEVEEAVEEGVVAAAGAKETELDGLFHAKKKS
jgi:hypothetical protein